MSSARASAQHLRQFGAGGDGLEIESFMGQLGRWKQRAVVEMNSELDGVPRPGIRVENEFEAFQTQGEPDRTDRYDGHAAGINVSVVAGGGFTLAFGYVQNKAGKGSWFFTVAPMTAVGIEASVGGFGSDIESTDGTDFDISEYGGWGYNHSVSLPFGGYSIGGNSNNKGDTKWGRTYEEQQGSYGPGLGYSYAKTYTFLFWGND